MNKSSFFIIGQHAVIEALRNPKRKVLRVFLTEESKKNIHRKSPKKNLLKDVKVYFKTKKELEVIGRNLGIEIDRRLKKDTILKQIKKQIMTVQ